MQCDLLDDGSGSSWGEELFFKTDRLHFNNVRRSIKNTSENTSPNKPLMKEILRERSVSPEQFFDKTQNDSGVLFKRYPMLPFEKQRLLWLCRYRENFDDLSVLSDDVDSGCFRRFAQSYRNAGLLDEAKFLDEARLRCEGEKLRSLVRHQDWSGSFGQMTAFGVAAAVGLTASAFAGMQAWSIFSFCVLFFVASWNVFTKKVVKWGITSILFVWDFFFRSGFRYGLSVIRPIVTIAIFLVSGWWGTQWLDDKGFLVLEVTVASSAILTVDGTVENSPILDTGGFSKQLKATDVRCGSTVDHGLYALDMFVPLIELDQDERCLIRPFDPSARSFGYTQSPQDISYRKIFQTDWIRGKSVHCPPGNIFCNAVFPIKVIINHPTTWRLAQSIYVLMGWLIVSATILTFSGVLRRQANGDE